MKILKIIGGVLIVFGFIAVLAEIFGYPLLIYYGDPVAGLAGLIAILLGIALLAVAASKGQMRGLNPVEIYIKFMDIYSEHLGVGVGWFTTAMVVIVFINVVLRYVFGQSLLALQDLSWYIFGAIFLVGAAYTLNHDRHVRVDIFYVNYPPKVRLWVNLLGTLIFLIPFCVLGIYVSWEFVMRSFSIAETSPDAGGLNARYLAKFIMPTGFGLILLQGIALAFKYILQLQGKMPIEKTGGAH